MGNINAFEKIMFENQKKKKKNMEIKDIFTLTTT